MINKSNIGELTIEQKDFKVTIKQKEEHVTQVVVAAPCTRPPSSSHAPQHSVSLQQPAPATGDSSQKQQILHQLNTITIKSPMIGTFYRKVVTR